MWSPVPTLCGPCCCPLSTAPAYGSLFSPRFPLHVMHHHNDTHVSSQPLRVTFPAYPVDRPSHPLPIWHFSRVFVAYLTHFFAHSSPLAFWMAEATTCQIMYSWLCPFMLVVSISFPSCNQMSSRNLIVPPETEMALAMTSSPACTPAVSLPLAETFRSSPGPTVPSKTSVS